MHIYNNKTDKEVLDDFLHGLAEMAKVENKAKMARDYAKFKRRFKAPMTIVMHQMIATEMSQLGWDTAGVINTNYMEAHEIVIMLEDMLTIMRPYAKFLYYHGKPDVLVPVVVAQEPQASKPISAYEALTQGKHK